MKRRQILIALALSPIAACAQISTSTSVPSAVAGDIDLVASGLTTLLSYIPLSTETRARYQGYLDTVVRLGKEVANAQDANAAKSIVQQVISSAEAALAVVASTNLPAAAATVVLAIRALLPIIATGVGILGLRTAPSSMSPEHARAVLARKVL
jgi:hypothetical protein